MHNHIITQVVRSVKSELSERDQSFMNIKETLFFVKYFSRNDIFIFFQSVQ